MRWILIGVLVVLVVAIAWPFLFGDPTVTVKDRSFTVKQVLGDQDRFEAMRGAGALNETAVLSSWDHDRYLYVWSDGARAAYDVAFLDAAGKVVETGTIRPYQGRDYLDDRGMASQVEARHILFLPGGTLENTALAVGDTIELPKSTPEPMISIKVGGKPVNVEVAETAVERNRGLMHRPNMSKGEGMLFIYPSARTGLSFYMRNTLMSLDIAYFDASGALVNVVSVERAKDPIYEGRNKHAPADGAAQYVLEMPIGWFRENGLTDERGKPLKPTSFEMTDTIRTIASKAQEPGQ